MTRRPKDRTTADAIITRDRLWHLFLHPRGWVQLCGLADALAVPHAAGANDNTRWCLVEDVLGAIRKTRARRKVEDK
jgi:hypothetical protein